MARVDELRLISRISRMYYELEIKQSEISRQLGISQASVSRFLERAKDEGIVRISVTIPAGVNSELEETLIHQYKLRDAIIVDCYSDTDESIINRDIGAAAAYYLETAINHNEVIGISSWSSALLALVDAFHSVQKRNNIRVIQILGGVGNPTAEAHANRLTSRLAGLVSGEAVFLPVPGILGSGNSLKVLEQDPYVQNAIQMFDEVTLALVGIGALQPSNLLKASGNIFTDEELALLSSKGAVGDALLRFFDIQGRAVQTELSDRVFSMKLEQLQKVERAIGVAGGVRKRAAILGALRGRYINILITDKCTAQWLAEEGSKA